MSITKREASLHELIKLVGVHEVGGNNRGPVVDKIERWDTLPGIGYSWCQSTQNFTWKVANDEYLAGGTASVWAFASWCRQRRYEVDRPLRGDHVTYDFYGHGPYDHVGQIEKVLRLGPLVVLRTIEGNTSKGDGGSQEDGGGIYRRTRIVRRSSVAFFRVPGYCPHPHRYEPHPKKVVLRDELKKGMHGPDVFVLQARLRKLGFFNYEPNGLYGGRTITAVRRFQASQRLTVDGIVGPNTRRALGL